MRSRTTLLVSAILVLAILAACGDSDEAVEFAGSSGSVATSERAGQTAEQIDLAPELVSVEAWYNSQPLTLEALRGEPVLLVFWATY